MKKGHFNTKGSRKNSNLRGLDGPFRKKAGSHLHVPHFLWVSRSTNGQWKLYPGLHSDFGDLPWPPCSVCWLTSLTEKYRPILSRVTSENCWYYYHAVLQGGIYLSAFTGMIHIGLLASQAQSNCFQGPGADGTPAPIYETHRNSFVMSIPRGALNMENRAGQSLECSRMSLSLDQWGAGQSSMEWHQALTRTRAGYTVIRGRQSTRVGQEVLRRVGWRPRWTAPAVLWARGRPRLAMPALSALWFFLIPVKWQPLPKTKRLRRVKEYPFYSVFVTLPGTTHCCRFSA